MDEIERAYERGMQEGLDLRDGLREQIAALTERLGDRDQDLKIVHHQLRGAVSLLRELAKMPLTATGKDFDPLVKAARDLLPDEYTPSARRGFRAASPGVGIAHTPPPMGDAATRENTPLTFRSLST